MQSEDRLGAVVRGVGVVSVGLSLLGLARPRRLTAVGGLADSSAVDLVVRLGAARQGVLGLALLTRSPVDVGRSARLFLPLTAVDAVVVIGAVRAGVLHRRSAALSLVVLATNAGIAARAR